MSSAYYFVNVHDGNEILNRTSIYIPFASTQVISWYVLLIFFACCVLFLYFVCLRSVSCMFNVASVCIMSIFDYPFGFLYAKGGTRMGQWYGKL